MAEYIIIGAVVVVVLALVFKPGLPKAAFRVVKEKLGTWKEK
jgi:hypothetical protein